MPPNINFWVAQTEFIPTGSGVCVSWTSFIRDGLRLIAQQELKIFAASPVTIHGSLVTALRTTGHGSRVTSVHGRAFGEKNPIGKSRAVR
ncbi:MAG: hypothetical protein WA817_20760, partial [Candidatus Acidiferrum sp.]